MNFYISLLLNAILFSLYSYISFSETFREKPYFVYMGLLLSLASNYLWLSYVKKATDNSEILINGLFWDAVIILTFAVVPFLLFKLELSKSTMVGFLIMVLGFSVVKGAKIYEYALKTKKAKQEVVNSQESINKPRAGRI
jgi:drug/metabolite transporter (DMT)-like permease